MENRYRDEHFELDFALGCACLDAKPMKLTRKEYELLAFLARNAREIIPRDILLNTVWGYSQEIRTRTLDVHIGRLRQKLGVYGDRYIETIFGIGYRFQPYRPAKRIEQYPPMLYAVAG